MTNPQELTRRRRLQDLYIRGKLVKVDDGTDPENPVEVWVQKITPFEMKQAMDKAHAIRARIKLAKESEDPDNDIFRIRVEGEGEINGFFNDRENMIAFIHAEELQKLRISFEAETAEQEEWSKDSYLDGLRVAWEDSLAEKFLLDPEDEEAKRVYDELNRWIAQTTEKLEPERQRILRESADISDDELKDRVLDLLVDGEADQAWLSEFRKWQLFFSLRDPDDHSVQYFETRDDLEMLDRNTIMALFVEFDDLMVDSTEGKD